MPQGKLKAVVNTDIHYINSSVKVRFHYLLPYLQNRTAMGRWRPESFSMKDFHGGGK